MRARIDDSFAEMVADLPVEMRSRCGDLPYQLGLVARPEMGWEDFVRMDANRDLPRYAAEDPAYPGTSRLPQATLCAYLRAHHLGAVYGLISDRVEDGQVPSTPWLVGLREEVFQRWTAALADATRSRRRAAALTASARTAMFWGNAREKEALADAHHAGGSLAAAEYARFSCAKLRWFGVTAHGLLLSLGEPGRARRLRTAYDAFSFGLQCMDDALDEEADRAGRGASFPGALGLPPEGLLAAVPALFSRASEIAASACFHELARWFGQIAGTYSRAPILGAPVRSMFAATLLQVAFEEVGS